SNPASTRPRSFVVPALPDNAMDTVSVLTSRQRAVASAYADAYAPNGVPGPPGSSGGFGAHAAAGRHVTTPNATTPNFQSTPNLQLPKLPKLPNVELASPLLDLEVLEVGSWALIGNWELRSCGVDTLARLLGRLDLPLNLRPIERVA